MINKAAVVLAFEQQINAKLIVLRTELLSLRASNEDNDKSSAGDKHETERSMVHSEMEKLVNQIDMEERLLNQLAQMDQNLMNDSVLNGSLVETNRGMFLLGAATGKVSVGQKLVFGVSMESPLAQQMKGKTSGDSFRLNGNSFIIHHLY